MNNKQIAIVVAICLVFVFILVLLIGSTCKDSFTNQEKKQGEKKILLINCFGYGNMGDNMYSELIRHELGKEGYSVVSLNDSKTFADHKGNIVLDKPPKKDYDFDAIVIGGGGILCDTNMLDNLKLSSVLIIWSVCCSGRFFGKLNVL